MQIRKYKKKDREKIEKIHFDLGFFGKSMNLLISTTKFWKKNISYYLNHEPESIFVIEHENKIKGYLLGCVDDEKNKNKIRVFLYNFENIFLSLISSKKDRIFWTSRLNVFIDIILGKSGELKLKHPQRAGHFHVNLLPEMQGQRWGSTLIKEFENYAKNKGVKKIHATIYESCDFKVKNFLKKNGFKIYSRVKTSSWKKFFPNKKIFLACYYKKL